MGFLPMVDNTPGLYQVLTNANQDYPLPIATDDDGTRARFLVVWFEAGASDATLVRGRIGFDKDGTAIPSGITGTDALLGYHPPVPIEYDLASVGDFGVANSLITHVHLACSTAGAVARGMWLFGN